MDLLRDIRIKKLKIRIAIIAVVVVAVVIAILVFLHIKQNRDSDIINKKILATEKNAVITINNDLSKIKLYPKTLEDIRENGKTIQVSNNEAKFVLNSDALQESNKVNPKVTTTNKYAQINNVVCIEIDTSDVKNRQIIDKIIVNVEKLNLDTEYIDIYTVNDNDEFTALKLKETILNNELQFNFDESIDKYIIAYVPVVNLAFNYNEINIKKGESVVLTCDVNDNATNSQLHAQVVDSNIIEVSGDGTVKGINAGQTQLIIQSYKNTVLKTINVIVKEIPSEIKVSKESASIYIGETYQIEAEVLPEAVENKNIKYTSSNTNIVTVSSKGKVTGIKKGSAKITLTTEETPEVSKEIEITVNEKPSEITLAEDKIEIYVGDKYTLNPTVLPETLENKKVTYTSSDESIVTVDSNGKLKGISEGTAQITITTDLKPEAWIKIPVYVSAKQVTTNNEVDNNTSQNNVIEY